MNSFSYHLGAPAAEGTIRVRPEDFRVEEVLGFALEGQGKHLWVKVEKTLLNTVDVVSTFARALGIAHKDIGISGQKDRRAVTRQWFSLPVVGDADRFTSNVIACCNNIAELRLLEQGLQPGKLRRGTHRSNQFDLVIRDFCGSREDTDRRLEAIEDTGFPNYFGPQRFGRNGKNLETAERLFSGELRRIDRQARSMALSSARSWLFNQVLSARLETNALDQTMLGDALQLDGSHSWFLHDGSDSTVVARIAAHDIHPTGPMWGAGDALVGEAVARFESSIVNRFQPLAEGLVREGLVQQRRALRVVPTDLAHRWRESDVLEIGFTLPSGAFATSLLRELIKSDGV